MFGGIERGSGLGFMNLVSRRDGATSLIQKFVRFPESTGIHNPPKPLAAPVLCPKPIIISRAITKSFGALLHSPHKRKGYHQRHVNHQYISLNPGHRYVLLMSDL
ncbi:unnamed protein product, partial [Mesorhabditis belari]|uniref:Uncharacterized protein n=1 Tax=Mesorhabditis belari TaxID=2138241 RepID=A0AAF3F218_9BILA